MTPWILAGLALAWILWGKRLTGPAPEVERAQRADATGQGRLPYGTHAQLARDLTTGGDAALTAGRRRLGGSSGAVTEAESDGGAPPLPDYFSPPGRSGGPL